MGEWSPSHLIVAAIAVATIIGQLIIVLTRLKTITERLEKQIDKQGETFFHALQRLEDRLDKRLSDTQAETNQRLSDLDANIRQLNQNHIEHLQRHDS